jgi:hypothetical protein
MTVAHAQRRPFGDASDTLIRALAATPARLAPPWLVRLCDFIAAPRATTPTRVETAAALDVPAPRRPRGSHVDHRDPYRGGVAPTAPAPFPTVVQTESGATSATAPRVSATRPALDPDDPYAAAAAPEARLTVSTVEADNPYF